MLQRNRVLAGSLAVLSLAGALAPVNANAWPLGRLFHLHPHPAAASDTRITVHLVNKDEFIQQVKVDGHVYTMMAHGALTIYAAEGTEVYAKSAGFSHRAGDLLFAVKPQMRETTIAID
jgi:hypothetical protein